MLAPSCVCLRPQVFDDSDTCCKCGRVSVVISPSTWRLALVLAEVALGHRCVGDRHGDHNVRVKSKP